MRWCERCLALAWGSPADDRDQAVVAIAHLGDTLGTAPGRQWSRAPVPHTLPDAARDQILAARMAAPSSDCLKRLGLSNWTEALALAGLLADGARSSRGFGSRAKDGHWCRSMLELAVDDFLTDRGLAHDCEPGWPQHPGLNPNGAKRADWRLSDGTMIEAAGMLDDPAYALRMVAKRQLADELGIRLLVVEPSDVNRLDIVFSPWLWSAIA